MKILKIIGIVILAFILILVLGGFTFFKILEYRGNHYYNYVTSNSPLEQKYSALGKYDVNSLTIPADDDFIKEYVIWYPKDIETNEKSYPLVVVANGTGTTASKYTGFFKHLSSWGFIVVGNEDENSRTGESSSNSLDLILGLNEDETSMFYGKVDTANVGITGHSQGGVGAVNAVTNWENGDYYKAIHTGSMTSPFHTTELGTDWAYDVTKLNIPFFYFSGTGYFDAGEATSITDTRPQGILPLYAMEEIYDELETKPKVMGRLIGIDHGETFKKGDAYMTGWFLWHLKNDETAKEIFVGDDAEIFNNELWQDVKKNF